jgi:hypothetical protein
MRRLIAFSVLAAFVIAPAALAKERNIALAGKPASTTAGKAWTATVKVTRDKMPDAGKAPTLRLINQSISSGGVVNVTMRATLTIGVYRARVVFPHAGTWRVVVIDRMTGRAYSFGRTVVRAEARDNIRPPNRNHAIEPSGARRNSASPGGPSSANSRSGS